jgi:hypothetical protein
MLARQAEVMELLRAHPHSTIAELVEITCPKDRHERVTRKNNFSNKLHHLKRFGMAAFVPSEKGVERRWYPIEEE